MVRVLTAVLSTVLIAASPAVAQTMRAVTAAELQSILGEAGLATSVIEDARTGAPVAHVQTAGGLQFWVRALDCSGTPKACATLMFFANFELGRSATAKDFEIVNRFNDSQVFGRAFVLPGRNLVGVDYVIELDGGVTMEHVASNIERWADVVNAFIGHFSDAQKTS